MASKKKITVKGNKTRRAGYASLALDCLERVIYKEKKRKE
jgi:hypothetical protein